jgi:hypothetical protein
MRLKPDLSLVRPWWLRLAVLFVVGLPLFTGWPIETTGRIFAPFFARAGYEPGFSMYIAVICSWFVYISLIWVLVYSNVGATVFWEYFGAALVLGLTTAFLGSAVCKLFPFIAGGESGYWISFKMTKIFIMVISTVPYLFMTVNLFSAQNVLEIGRQRCSQKGTFPPIYLHWCLALRMFQHVADVVRRLLDVWAEENPDLLLPRNRRDWGVKWYSTANFFSWAAEAISAWIFACLILTFVPLPAFVHELQNIRVTARQGETA